MRARPRARRGHRGRPRRRHRGDLRLRRVRPVPRGPLQPVRDDRHDRARRDGRRRDERVVPRAGALAGRPPRGTRPRRAPAWWSRPRWRGTPCRARRRRARHAGGRRRRRRHRADGGAPRPGRWAPRRCRSRLATRTRSSWASGSGATQPSGLYDVVIEAAGSESALHRCSRARRARRRDGRARRVRTRRAVAADAVLHEGGAVRCPRSATASTTAGATSTTPPSSWRRRPHLVDALVTHRFPIEDAPEAFRVAADKTTGALRVVLEPNPT